MTSPVCIGLISFFLLAWVGGKLKMEVEVWLRHWLLLEDCSTDGLYSGYGVGLGWLGDIPAMKNGAIGCAVDVG